MDFPAPGSFAPSYVPTLSRYGAAMEFGGVSVAVIAMVANRAIYTPMWLPWHYPVRRVYWVNGTTASSNMDFGIYTADGERLYSTGSTAQSGTSVAQYVTPSSPLLLTPGLYYFALACNGTTSRAFGAGSLTLTLSRTSGILQEDTALPLPAAMTPAAIATGIIPLCGVTLTAS